MAKKNQLNRSLIFNIRLLIAVFLTIIYGSFAQSSGKYVGGKNSLSVNLFGTSGVIGVTYERLITGKISVEFGFGAVGFGAGAVYYPFKVKKNKVNPYIGIKYNQIIILTERATYIPIGITFVSKWNINFGTDIGFARYHKTYLRKIPSFAFKDSQYGYLWNVKVGFRF